MEQGRIECPFCNNDIEVEVKVVIPPIEEPVEAPNVDIPWDSGYTSPDSGFTSPPSGTYFVVE